MRKPQLHIQLKTCLSRCAVGLYIWAASGAGAFAASEVAQADGLRIGDVVSGSLAYGRRTFALPGGSWRLVSKSGRNPSTTGDSGSQMLQATFDQVVDKRLGRTLELVATKYSKTVNWLDEPCKNKGDSYWIDDRKRGMNDQFCVRVGYSSGVVDGAKGEAFEAWARDIIAKGIGYSRDMPFLRVTRFTPYDFLQMTVKVDAEGVGVARSKRPERQFNDWHPQTLANHPDRQAIYESLKAWAAKFAPAVDRAFAGDKSLTSDDFGSLILPRKQ
jgi:hypothetical protein